MVNTMSKRAKIRTISFISALFLALLVTAIIGNVQSAKYERQVLLSQQRALTDLDSCISNISTNLEKGIYANTPTMLDTMATALSREAMGAKSSLSALPLSDTNLDNTYKFLSQVGDFVLALNRKTAAGETISAEERQQLTALLGFAKTLSEQVSAMRLNMLSGNFRFEDSESTLMADSAQIASLAQNMEDTEQTLTDYPSLIYDGPFSDHINQLSPKMLENREEISQEKAKQKAADFLGVSADELSFVSEEADNTASYCFSYAKKSIAVTKRGGYVLYLLNSAYAGEVKLSYEEALAAAQNFLHEKGYDNMKESYYATADGVCTINFAYTQKDVVCYPDLIKVGVSLDTGEIFSFDSRGFIMNHHERQIGDPKISEETAKQSVSPFLTVLKSQLTVIPTDSGDEKYCYEFHCKDENGTEVLVYIDNETGYEDEILLLLYSDGGILTK